MNAPDAVRPSGLADPFAAFAAAPPVRVVPAIGSRWRATAAPQAPAGTGASLSTESESPGKVVRASRQSAKGILTGTRTRRRCRTSFLPVSRWVLLQVVAFSLRCLWPAEGNPIGGGGVGSWVSLPQAGRVANLNLICQPEWLYHSYALRFLYPRPSPPPLAAS